MSSNPREFAKRVLQAFEAAGLATDEEVGDAGGPSTTTLAKYRKVAADEMTMSDPRGDVLRRIDLAARWRPGSARLLWREQKEPELSKVMSLSESLGGVRPKPGRVVQGHGEERYVAWLAERLSEVEERLDLIVDSLEKLSEQAPNLRAVANRGDVEPEDGALE